MGLEITEDDSSGAGNNNHLQRLAKIPRLYRLLRILRLVKLVRVVKYSSFLKSLMAEIKMNAGINRMLQTTAIVFLMVHLVSCIWFLIAKMNDFHEDTWVA